MFTRKRITMRLFLLLGIALIAVAQQEEESNSNSNSNSNNNALPLGVTICDGSDPVGDVQAFLLQTAIPYCMNNGTCTHNYHHPNPCHCPDGVEGPHCEFEQGTTPDCTLQCYNGGHCKAGAKSFELVYNEWQPIDELQYCHCLNGTSGLNCEVQEETCGDSHCLHGGTCVTIIKDDDDDDDDDDGSGGEKSKHCDCTTATTGDNAYAGRFCQHKATTFCSDIDDQNGHQFCVNGGTCKGGSHLGCDCPDGFIGPVCEFKDEEIEHSRCTLECENGGICRKGAKDYSFLQKFGDFHRGLLHYTHNSDFEHCVCPSGWVGLTCQYEMEICPGREYACMHGGECEIVSNGGSDVDLQCDCRNAQTENSRFAGEYCQVRSTSFCIVDGEKTEDGDGYDAFCTNGGTCRDVVESGNEHPGCDCQRGYYGDYCEFQEESWVVSNKAFYVGTIAGLSSLAFCFGAFVCVWRRRRHAAFRVSNKRYKDSPPPPTLDHIQSLEPWMRSKLSLYEAAEVDHDRHMPVISLVDSPPDSPREGANSLSLVTWNDINRSPPRNRSHSSSSLGPDNGEEANNSPKNSAHVELI